MKGGLLVAGKVDGDDGGQSGHVLEGAEVAFGQDEHCGFRALLDFFSDVVCEPADLDVGEIDF